MLRIIILALLSGCLNANVVQGGSLELAGPYVLPKYPEAVVQPWIDGLLSFDVRVAKGSVEGIKVVSQKAIAGVRRSTSPTAERLRPEYSALQLFIKAAEEALIKWKFHDSESAKFNVAIWFMLVDSSREDGEKNYVVYRVEGSPNRIPTRIIVEAHRIFTQ